MLNLIAAGEIDRWRRRLQSCAAMARYDAVIVGSGINSLAAGALLAKGGWSVCILERNDWLGGAVKTAEITRPGLVHEGFASWDPLLVGPAAYPALKDRPHARGLGDP